MKAKYNQYLESQKKPEPVVEEAPLNEEIKEEESFDDTIFSEPILASDYEDEEDVKPSLVITDEVSVINEEPIEKVKPLFDNADDETKDIIPDDMDVKEKGSASAIIISIIAVIIGILVMYSIIKLN